MGTARAARLLLCTQAHPECPGVGSQAPRTSGDLLGARRTCSPQGFMRLVEVSRKRKLTFYQASYETLRWYLHHFSRVVVLLRYQYTVFGKDEGENSSTGEKILAVSSP